MEKLKVKIVYRGKHELPFYASEHAAGMDLYANIDADILLKPLDRAIIPTGIYMELPIGYEAQIRPRSGLAAKKGITVLNSPGTIDADYRGEVGVILVNCSNTEFTVKDGERVAQMVIAKHETIVWEVVEKLEESERGSGGYGHTGKK